MSKTNLNLLTVSIALTLFFTVDSFAQIQQPQTPTFQQFKPIQPNQPYTPPSNKSNQYQQPNNNQYQPKIQVTKAEELIQYSNSPLIPGGKRSQEKELRKILAEDEPGYYNPSAENNFRQMTPQMKMQHEMTEVLYEASYNSAMVSEYQYYNSARYLNDLPNYIKAKDLIKEMLEGKRALSIKDAYFLAESAYGNLHLSYEEYNKIIKDNANFIKQWLIENAYNPKDPEAIHLGIQKFLTDTLSISNNGMDKSLQVNMKNGHIPYHYDFIDYTSEKDRRNYFVSKTLATGTGQCHTLPVTYLILAEALGVETYLSYNPEHSFVRYINNEGTLVNFETTIGRYMLDQFYSEALPVMAEAKRNSILMNSLNKKQVVASVLVDLAVNFIQEHWLSDRKFINECMDAAAKHFPNKGYINTASHYVNRRLHAATFNNIVQKKGIKDLKEIENHPEALAAYNDFINYMKKITALGVQEFPEEEYIRLMQYHDQKGKLQIAKRIDTKSKKNLFINY